MMDKQARYQAARKHARLTQVQLADKAGLSQQMVSKLEKGLTSESTFDVKIATACGVRAEWLDSEDGPMVAKLENSRAADPRLKVDLEATNNALAAFAVAASNSTPKLAEAFLSELNRMPDEYKSRGIYTVLIGLLERGMASRARNQKHLRNRASRGSTARNLA